MAQNIQIVPKFSFPYVETVINDYTVVDGTSVTTGVSEDPIIRYIMPFRSSKGIDNRYIRKRTRQNVVSAYGETNYKKYGQPLMQALNIVDSNFTEVWCMRVMPEHATYAHNNVIAYYKKDSASDVPTASKRRFRIKFVGKPTKNASADGGFGGFKYKETSTGTICISPDAETDKSVYTVNKLEAIIKQLNDGSTNDTDSEGYASAGVVTSIRCAGRGKYGNNYRVRIGQDISYEKNYGIKFYDYEVLNVENGITKEASYIGTAVTSSKYENATLINDVLDNVEDGLIPVFIDFDEDIVETIYCEYKDWVTDLIPALTTERATKAASIPEGMVEGLIPVTDEHYAAVQEVKKIDDMLVQAKNVPDLDQFDIIFGRNVATTNAIPFIEYPMELTDGITFTELGSNPTKEENEANYLAHAAYTESEDVVSWDSVQGVKLFHGDDGEFDSPRTVQLIGYTDGSDPTKLQTWTADDEIEECYTKAFTGEYDRRILTAKRIKANALWDANYPMKVKNSLADLAILRNDALCYLDCGIMSALSTAELKKLIADYSVFADHKISKNIHHYYVKEPTTKKKIPVTISYFLSRQYCNHVVNYGAYVPFVKSYAQLSGHIKDSLYPTVEDYETDLKEQLTENRFNYFETVDDNVYQRATQNTAQVVESDLLEESNVTTLYDMKRIIERDVIDNLYDFSDSDTRNRFRTYERAKFASWSNRDVESFDIEFGMNDWENERSILHAYLSVSFRGLQKKAILEIDVNKRDSMTLTTEV